MYRPFKEETSIYQYQVTRGHPISKKEEKKKSLGLSSIWPTIWEAAVDSILAYLLPLSQRGGASTLPVSATCTWGGRVLGDALLAVFNVYVAQTVSSFVGEAVL